jgi:lipid-A-disaccharide synthase
MKYFFVAGEASGDLHASNLIRELKKLDDKAQIKAWGGDLMEKEGATILKHYRDLAFMGIIEVVQNIRTIMQNFSLCKQHIFTYKPDVLVLVDYPGFNLRMAKFANQQHIPVCYYISPKVWVWKESRVYKIKKYVDRLFCIFPFEIEFYKTFGYEATYVGNPVLDAIEDFKSRKKKKIQSVEILKNVEKPVIALLAGSRYQEINLLLPEMIEIARHFRDYQFIVAGAPSISMDYYRQFLSGTDIKIVDNKTYELLETAHAAVVTSGTATLETALFDVPQVVIYKTNQWSYNIGQVFIWLGTIKVKFFSLVNILLRREAVKEILQYHVAEQTRNELRKILSDTNHYKRIQQDYQEMKSILGPVGASKNAALGIYHFLKSQTT